MIDTGPGNFSMYCIFQLKDMLQKAICFSFEQISSGSYGVERLLSVVNYLAWGFKVVRQRSPPFVSKVGEGSGSLSAVGTQSLVGFCSSSLLCLPAISSNPQRCQLLSRTAVASCHAPITYKLHNHFQPLTSNISSEQQRHLFKCTPFHAHSQVKKK